MPIESINAKLDEMDCAIYFFRTWGTHTHPVLPIDALYFEDAIKRDVYTRAWKSVGSTERFVFLETVGLERHETDIKAKVVDGKLAIYKVRRSAGKVELGDVLALTDILREEEFLFNINGSNVILLKQRLRMSFRYRYREDGSLKSVTVKNIDGEVRVLDY